MKNRWLLTLCLVLFSVLNLEAIELRKNKANLVETQQYNEDYMFIGHDLEFKGEANDLYFIGKEINLSGNLSLASFLLGRGIYVTGNIGNGIKAVARTITVDGKVKGTNFLGAEKIVFGKDSEINGDTFLGARKVSIVGKMTGDLYAGAGEIAVKNEIRGDVNVYTGQLSIPEQGKIIGNLIYHSDQELNEDEAARVTGEITFERIESKRFNSKFGDDNIFESIWFTSFIKISFILCGLLLLLFPATKMLDKRFNHNEIISYSLWGLIPILAYPSVIVISIFLIITLPLTAVLLFAFMPLVFITKVLGITMIGSLIAEKVNFKINSRYLFFLISTVFYSLLSFIPIIGVLLLIFVSSIGCGLILSALFNKKLA